MVEARKPYAVSSTCNTLYVCYELDRIIAGAHRFSPSSSQALTESSLEGRVCCVASSDGPPRNSAESSETRGTSICAINAVTLL